MEYFSKRTTSGTKLESSDLYEDAVDYPYYRNDRLSRGFNASVRDTLIARLRDVFPQLEGIEIDHSWGGSMSSTRDLTPSVGVLGPFENVYYGVGFFEGVPPHRRRGASSRISWRANATHLPSTKS